MVFLRAYSISFGNRLALLIARLIATGWSTYALWRTTNISNRLQHIIEGPDSPCHLELYGPYFARRTSLQVWFESLYPAAPPQSALDCGPCLALGCPCYFRYPLVAPLQGIRLPPLEDISLLTYARSIALIHSGALDRRKTSCGCMQYVFQAVRSSGMY